MGRGHLGPKLRTLAGMGDLQLYVLWGLGVVAFGAEVYALVDAARTRADAFPVAGKLSKPKWLSILGVATAVGFLALPGGFMTILNFLPIIAFAAAAVYLADVRPAVRQIRGGGGRPGPYGPW